MLEKGIVHKEKLKKVIAYFSDKTLGIYIMEPTIKLYFRNVYLQLEEALPSILASFAWVIFAAFIGTLVTIVLKKIPLIKKMI